MNIPTIPDNIYKVIILIEIFLIGIGYLQVILKFNKLRFLMQTLKTENFV
jgi:hypothetical protein